MSEEQPPAAPPAPPAEQPPIVAPSAPSPSTWTEGFDDVQKGFIQTKGFESPKSLLESYINLEKLRGVPQDRLITLPENMDGPEAAAIWEKLGAPKEAKDYQIEIPEEFGDEKLAEWAKEKFHELKVPRKMAEAFVKDWNERQIAAFKEIEEQANHAVEEEQNTLKKEWGSAYEQNENIANAAAAQLEISEEEVQALGAAMGPAKALKFLHKLGEGIGEAKYIDGTAGKNAIPTTVQAKTEIKQLMADAGFARRLQSGDVEAKAKWDRLHKQASPGEMTI